MDTFNCPDTDFCVKFTYMMKEYFSIEELQTIIVLLNNFIEGD